MRPPAARVLRLQDLPLERVTAHDGEGRILFNRVLDRDRFEGPFDFVDYVVIPPGASIGLHQHGQNEELYLVLEGEGVLTLDGEEFDVQPGTVALNRPGGEHALRNTGRCDLRLFVVEVTIRDSGGGRDS